jgi:hypothetical protein
MQEVGDTQDTLSNPLSDDPGGFGSARSEHADPSQAPDTGDCTSEALVREPATRQEVAETQDTSAKPAPRAEAWPGPARAIQTPAPTTTTRAATDTARNTRGLTE